MASVVLSGTPAGLAPLSSPIIAQAVGGGKVISQWDGTAFGNGEVQCQMGSGQAGGNPAFMLTGGATQATQALRWGIGTSGAEPLVPGTNTGNNFSLFSYSDDGLSSAQPLNIDRSTGRLLVDPGFNPLHCGIATIPTGATSVVVNSGLVSAGSIIVCSPFGQADNVPGAGYVTSVVVTAGVSFTISVNAAVTGAGLGIAYWIPVF